MDELPQLTGRQQQFLDGLLAGKIGVDAYRATYNCANLSDAAIRVEASRLKHLRKVTLTLSAVRMACLGPPKATLENHIRELERLKEIAINSGNVGAAVQAEQLRGKVMGFYTKKSEVAAQQPGRRLY